MAQNHRVDLDQTAASTMREDPRHAIDRLAQRPQLTYERRLTFGGMKEVNANVKGAIDQSLRDQPMATVAMAAIVGFVLGILWKA
jgi:ElaB/YqjD/DUF883 family membrane-anchored ribosome-binding protein